MLTFDCGNLQGKPAILMFHRVLPRAELRSHLVERPRFEMSDEYFGHVLQGMEADGYRFVSLDELTRRIVERRPVDHFAAITFDDGFSDIVLHALPLLERYDAPFTTYVTTGYPDGELLHVSEAIEAMVRSTDHVALELPEGALRLDTTTRARKTAAVKAIELAVFSQFPTIASAATALGLDVASVRACALTWEEVYALSRHPLCVLGAHTVTHRDLTRASRAEIRWELEESNRRLAAHTGKVPLHFAYPFGRYDAVSREEGLRAGYRVIVKTGCACVDLGELDLAALPRVCALETARAA
jgi:peptidoglycan/xylan/chitin deacetylase (PgdA/CDA1 family)